MRKMLGIMLASVMLLLTACDSSEETEAENSTSNGGEEHVEFIKNWEDTTLTFDGSAEQPSEEEVNDMIYAATKAPTGLNLQPYRLTVITDYETQEELALTPEVTPTEGTVMFIYSYEEENDPPTTDVGISYGYLHAMAQAYGYGTHIYGQPARMLADDGNPQEYGVPEGYVPLEFVLLGKTDQEDPVSAATSGEREEVHNFYAPGE